MKFFCALLGFLLLVGCDSFRSTALAQDVNASKICTSRMYVTDISIEGNRKTRAAVILRELSFEAGNNVCGDSLTYLTQLNYQRLYNLNLFTDIDVSFVEESDTSCRFVIKLKEQWFILPQADVQLADRNINVWWNEQGRDLSRVNLGLYIVHKNLSGNLDQLRISTHVGYTQQVNVSYQYPYLDKRQRYGVGVSAGFSRSKELAFATQDNKLQFAHNEHDFLYQYGFVALSYIYRSGYHHRHIVSTSYHHYQIGDTIHQLNPNYFLKHSTQLRFLELGYRYEYNGVDNWNYPRKGIKLVAHNAFRFGLYQNRAQMHTNIEAGFFSRIKPRLLGVVVLRARNTFGNEQSYFMKSALGYQTNIVRGYEYYVVEADRFLISRFTLKYDAFHKVWNHLDIPYVPKIPLWIYPKVFADFGYAYNKQAGSTNTLANTLLYSVGVGVDIITAYDLKLRIEFAWNHLGENGLYLHANSE